MRVAIVLNKFDSGGIENMVVNYYRHIDKEKIQYDIYYNENSSIPQHDELKSLGAGLYPIPSYSKIFSYQRCLRKAFREKKYEIVHVQINTMSLFALYAAKRCAVPVRICHAHARGCKSEGLRYLIKLVLKPFNKLFATDLAACCEESGRWMFGNHSFTIIPNAVETDRFAYDEDARKSIRKGLGIPEDAFVLGHVGRFIVEKNHDFLIKIFKEIPNAYLLLVGEGKLSENYVGDRIIKTGARKDVNKIYSAMDAFCMPSLSEGLPVVVIEAQTNGLPCIVSKAIPQEADIGNIIWHSLSEEPSKWAYSIMNSKRHEIDNKDKYDIKINAEKLENFYLSKVKEN